ncbi:MAG: ribosome biogenesis GTPase Der, partial [Lentisphaeria bacterium]|nr:ribosome biogenesis GTPase Der [Lentisphaeria bacterium]
GGLGVRMAEKKVDLFDGLVREQVTEIVAEADVLVWVVDCQDGVTPQDEEVASFLRQSGRPVVLAANKADNETMRAAAESDFAKLGFPRIVPTSCTHNHGVPRLLEAALPLAPSCRTVSEAVEEPFRIAVVGRPNVGKSSLVNRLLGAERVMVSDIAGTTRDAVDVPFVIRDGDESVSASLIDTAGLRRRRQVDSVVEFFSAARAQKAIRRSDVVLLILDATAPGTSQDRRIARLVVDAQKPCILLANKWDLASEEMKQKELVLRIRENMSFMKHAPVHAVCALSGYNFSGILEHVLMVREQMRVSIPTSLVNQFLQDIFMRTPPPAVGTKRFKVLYGTMVSNPPPRFVLFCNDPKICAANYLQFLENRLRDAFFPEAGLPLHVELRARKAPKGTENRRNAMAGEARKRREERQAIARRHARKKGWRKK